MDQPALSPDRRLYALQAYSRAVDAFDTVAWRAPSAARFDGRAANDLEAVEPPADPTLRQVIKGLPGWVTVVAGGLIAALMGALLGGALHI